MAIPVYSANLYTAQAQTTAITETTISGFTTVFRCIDIVFHSGSAGQLAYLKGELGQFIYYIVSPSTSANWVQWKGRQAFRPGITYTFGVSGVADITASGYFLSGTLP